MFRCIFSTTAEHFSSMIIRSLRVSQVLYCIMVAPDASHTPVKVFGQFSVNCSGSTGHLTLKTMNIVEHMDIGIGDTWGTHFSRICTCNVFLGRADTEQKHV